MFGGDGDNMAYSRLRAFAVVALTAGTVLIAGGCDSGGGDHDTYGGGLKTPAARAGYKSGRFGEAGDLYDKGYTMKQACEAAQRDYILSGDVTDDEVMQFGIGCYSGVCNDKPDCRIS